LPEIGGDEEDQVRDEENDEDKDKDHDYDCDYDYDCDKDGEGGGTGEVAPEPVVLDELVAGCPGTDNSLPNDHEKLAAELEQVPNEAATYVDPADALSGCAKQTRLFASRSRCEKPIGRSGSPRDGGSGGARVATVAAMRAVDGCGPSV
jgi:hypothetical protein